MDTKSLTRMAAVFVLGVCGTVARADDATNSSAAPSESPATEIRTVERPSISIAPQADVSVRTSGPKITSAGPVINMGKVEKVNDRYPNGKIKVEREVGQDTKGNYVNQGTYRVFDQDGQIIMAGEFLNGKQNGKWMQQFAKDEGHLFSPDPEGEFAGPFTSEATFMDGRLHGAWTIKDAGGQAVVQWSFDNGTRNGTWTWWHPNGKKRLEATYRGGTLNGDVQEWDRDEKLISKTAYVDGKILAKVTGWYTIGQKHYEGYYLKTDTMPEATYDWWSSRVTLGAAPAAGQDQKHGVWVSWYRNGAKQTESQYDRDLRIGKFKWWHENGQPQAEGDYEAGKKIGVWITWHPNGLKESQADYKDDQLVGKSWHWDADGNLVDSAPSDGRPQQSQPDRGNTAPRPTGAVSSR
ncbi:MAG TPA: hypothetical protein VGY55_17440 [Pirellulales bacterium]|nr:hypothetical protein [Pirellulales bacterium]